MSKNILRVFPDYRTAVRAHLMKTLSVLSRLSAMVSQQVSSTAALAAIILMGSGLSACSGPEPCGIGERHQGGSCVQVPYLQIHFDERTDVTRGGVRQGIGANACFYERDEQQVLVRLNECQTVRFSGSSSARPMPFSAGGIAVHLDDPLVLSKSDDAACYETQLDGSRETLYDDDTPFLVEILGGGDLESLPLLLNAPPEMSLSHDDNVKKTQDFHLSWPQSEAPASHVLAVLRVFDEVNDESTHAVCFFADTGEARFPVEIISPLFLNGEAFDPLATLYVLRQNWLHVEPEVDGEIQISIEAFASRSIVSDVYLLEE